MHTRFFEKNDIPQLLTLMKELAVFEDYIDDFRVTEQDLMTLGLSENPVFKSLVVVEGNIILGYCAYYSIAFTYNLKPKFVLKELYVKETARDKSVGSLLIDRLKKEAVKQNAAKIEWLVLPDNNGAKRFYKRHGAKIDDAWDTMYINC